MTMKEQIEQLKKWLEEKLEDPYNFVEETAVLRQVLKKFNEIFNK